MAAVRGERARTPGGAAQDRDHEIRERQGHHGHGQQHGHVSRDVPEAEALERAEVGGDGHRRRGEQQPQQEGPALPHEHRGRVPVVREEAGTRPDQQRHQQRGEVRVVELVDGARQQVRVDEERGAPDQGDPRREAVQAVHEVDRVHGQDHDEHGQQDLHGLAAHRDPPHGHGLDADPPEGHREGGAALAHELGPPRQVDEVVHGAHHEDDGQRRQEAVDGRRIREDAREEGHRSCQGQPDEDGRQHRHAAELRDGPAVHVPVAQRRPRADAPPDLPQERGQRHAGERRDEHDQEVGTHGGPVSAPRGPGRSAPPAPAAPPPRPAGPGRARGAPRAARIPAARPGTG